MRYPYPTTREPHDLEADLRTIYRIPDALLDGEPREKLIELTHYVNQVYAYKPAAAGYKDWNIWIDALAERRHDRNGRIPLDEWNANYQALFAEATRE
jgi:hypothetical protein